MTVAPRGRRRLRRSSASAPGTACVEVEASDARRSTPPAPRLRRRSAAEARRPRAARPRAVLLGLLRHGAVVQSCSGRPGERPRPKRGPARTSPMDRPSTVSWRPVRAASRGQGSYTVDVNGDGGRGRSMSNSASPRTTRRSRSRCAGEFVWTGRCPPDSAASMVPTAAARRDQRRCGPSVGPVDRRAPGARRRAVRRPRPRPAPAGRGCGVDRGSGSGRRAVLADLGFAPGCTSRRPRCSWWRQTRRHRRDGRGTADARSAGHPAITQRGSGALAVLEPGAELRLGSRASLRRLTLRGWQDDPRDRRVVRVVRLLVDQAPDLSLTVRVTQTS